MECKGIYWEQMLKNMINQISSFVHIKGDRWFPFSMRGVDTMLQYKIFPRISHNIPPEFTQICECVYTYFYWNSSIYCFELFYKIQFTQKMDILIDEWN